MIESLQEKIKKKTKNNSAATKRGLYKKRLRRSSATDDIDSLTGSNELANKIA